MTISVIVEDGSGLNNANSYISIDEAKSYCLARGIELPDNDDGIAQLLILTCDYISLFSSKFVGIQTNTTQALDWPRCEWVNGVQEQITLDDGTVILTNEIPQILKKAQLSLLKTYSENIDLFSIKQSSDFVTREIIGPVTTEYSDPSKLSKEISIPQFSNLISRLFNDTFMGSSFTIFRA